MAAAEKKIADALQKGGFIRQPQVTIVLLQIRGNQVSVLGQVNRPGRFPLETANTRLSRHAGHGRRRHGLGGDDVVIVSGERDGKEFRRLIDIPAIYLNNKPGRHRPEGRRHHLCAPRAGVLHLRRSAAPRVRSASNAA
jgi:polysaccharide export outer membrane protein